MSARSVCDLAAKDGFDVVMFGEVLTIM